MKLKTLKTDHEIKYFDIFKICKNRDIIHKTIVLYAHKQADVSERINFTILNKIYSLLFIAKLAEIFWAEALNAAMYFYNKTLSEMRYNKKPSLNYIKIWGSIIYSKIYNAKILDSRAKPSILIDYNSN